jgi:proliferating cell nuclear antigen
MSKIVDIRTVQAVPFKTMAEALKEILVDINIEFNETGLKIMEIDATQSVLVHLKLDANQFQVYKCSKRIIIGVSIINLFKLIKTITNNDILQLYIEENDENVLNICIENSEKKYFTKYQLNLLEIDYNEYECPSKKFESQIILPSQCLQKICRDMGNLSDIVEVQVINNSLVFKCEGDFAKQETIFKEGDNISNGDGEKQGDNIIFKDNETDTPDIIQGYYSLKHLISFTKCTNLCQSLEIYINNNYPLIIVYDIGNMGKLTLCLSPKQLANN